MSSTADKVFGIIGNPRKEKVWEILPKLLMWFEDQKQELLISPGLERAITSGMNCISTRPEEIIAKNVDLILALGGDGTILHIARLVGDTGTPILGIRLGGLGFLAEVYLDEIYDRLHRILDDNYNIEKRMTLAADVIKGK